jgi:four helix bundle protein
MEIWQRAADVSRPLFKLADKLDERRYHRFAEQLRAAVLSITNNIALRPVGRSETNPETTRRRALRPVEA